MVKVLVTGANSLLGTNTIKELIANNYFVVALVRNENKFIIKGEKNIELIVGDILNYYLLESIIIDCEYIIHTAAETQQGLINYTDYVNANITGTTNLLNAAIKNKVKKFIYISTCNVFGYGSINNLGDETSKIKKPFSDSNYVKSKLEAQKIVMSFSDRIEVISINPTFLIGAYDQKPSSGRIILLGYNKKVIFYPPGGKNFVDVKDASKGIVNSLFRGKNEEAYIFAGENLAYKDFFIKLSKYSEKKTLLIKIPGFILIIIGIMGNLARLLGVKTETSLTNMRILCVKNFYTNKKAENELDIKFNTIGDAINDAIKWFKINGMIENNYH